MTKGQNSANSLNELFPFKMTISVTYLWFYTKIRLVNINIISDLDILEFLF